ncbi:UDP-N-acetylglucosamine 1-carboxyvinyltransferase [Halomonas mongoliensis]|uniref:UDP-N-acetylglucosamine 1-carboxyvinyltransferase n=1 Tax=Halomonas mongoliensis TaxID=321265 RepID=A0ABU1GMM0_9GAMM|nr:UDP-N-acetylglucosamine 1-carboxyvinyltransferase [Halomonas mongoliensis]MDR5893265.1 UDP-N-acetylglucosamine 1-carboxyvinyltransferase [Halomonas mongoliensis]
MKVKLAGSQSLNGAVTVSGAKNSATRVLAAALLSSGCVNLRNFPLALEDAKAKINFMQELGAKIKINEPQSELELSVPTLSFDGIKDFSLPIRTTYLLAAGALARNGHAKVPYPGGCKIGSRGYDLHMMVWRQLGCAVDECPEYIDVRGRLTGGVIDFPISTVGGTENALMCASVASGETLIRNAYVTPEISDLIAFLREMGAHIVQEGSSHIRVQGSGGLLRGASFSIMPDRIEALTWIILGAVTGGNLLVHNVPFETMEVPLIHLRDAGIDLFRNSSTVMVSPDCIGPHGIQPFELATGTHPGVISDMQSFFAFLGFFANGRSVVFDYRYPERIAYAHELEKFAPGAIVAEPGKITVQGPNRLHGAKAKSTDLRGSMAQIMAAICAEGESQVDGVELALRGYNNLPEKLASLGVSAQWSD